MSVEEEPPTRALAQRAGTSLPHPSQQPRYDWESIKARYVEGVAPEDGAEPGQRIWPSLDEVARHFGVPLQTVKTKSARQRWRDDRAAHQASIEKIRRQARAESMAKEAVDLDARVLGGTKAGVSLALSRLQEIAERQRILNTRRANGVHIDVLDRAVDARELKTLAEALDLFHRTAGRVLGDVEVTRTEVTGAGGGAVQIHQELTRDDPDRLVGVFAVLQRAGVGDILGAAVAGGAAALAGLGHEDGTAAAAHAALPR